MSFDKTRSWKYQVPHRQRIARKSGVDAAGPPTVSNKKGGPKTALDEKL